MLEPIRMKALLSIKTTLILLLQIQHLQRSAWAHSIDKQSVPDIQTLNPTSPSGNQLSDHTPEAVASDNVDLQRPDLRRPVWNMAHMVNSIKELDYRLGKGANSIEVDVTFGKDGDPLYTYHGPPCDCWRHCHQREDFNDYLAYVRQITMDEADGIGKNLYLVLLDLKLDYLTHKGKAHAGSELAKSIATILYGSEGGYEPFVDGSNDIQSSNQDANKATTTSKESLLRQPVRIVLSVNHVTDVELVQHFLHYIEQNNATHLMDRIGFDVGMNDDLQLIETMWKRFGNSLNVWQGDGYTNCISPFYNLERLSKALVKRDSVNGYPRKVYQWTIDLHDRMRESLKLGVDAVMTNHPERLLAVLSEPDIAHEYRLAGLLDDPFKKIIQKPSARSGETARYQRSTSGPNSGGFFGGLYDVISSLFAYMREIPFLSFPTTSRFMPKVALKRHKQAATTIITAKAAPPEYRTTSSAASSTITTTTSTTRSHKEQTSISATETTNSDQNATTADTTTTTPTTTNEPPYEGPKWYTSLASNMLVSAIKIILPENRTRTDKD